MNPMTSRINLDTLLQNSYRDFHVNGFDYLCLKRTPTLTEKLYFFDGDLAKLPEVVAPHDHRYNFHTRVLAGRSQNAVFEHNDEFGTQYAEYSYMTPLNGGDGFAWCGYRNLLEVSRKTFDRGEDYFMTADQLHTIRIVGNETILYLRQYEDEIGLDEPSFTYFPSDIDRPDLSGLYSRMSVDHALMRLRQLARVTGFEFTMTFDEAA